MGSSRWVAVGVFLLALGAPQGRAAEVTVPLLELLTRGAVDGGRFGLQTEGELDVLVPGEQVSAGARIGFAADTVSGPPDPTALTLVEASLTVAGLFGGSGDLILFYGERDVLGSGGAFPGRFSAPDPGTLYSGFGHFPTGPRYEGIHPLAGTGFQLDFSPHPDRLLLSWYLYQDGRVDGDAVPSNFEAGYYSTDLRLLLSLPRLRLESFAGYTWPAPDSPAGWVRGGLLFHAAEAGVEFFAQLGVPRWSPTGDTLDIRLLYLLFEPRVRLGRFGIIPTFFWHPGFYGQADTGEQAFDLNLNLLFGGWPGPRPAALQAEGLPGAEPEPGAEGERDGGPVSGGLETRLSYVMEEDSVDVSELRLLVSPYLRVRTPAITLDFRLSAHLLPFVPEELLEAFVGARVGL